MDIFVKILEGPYLKLYKGFYEIYSFPLFFGKSAYEAQAYFSTQHSPPWLNFVWCGLKAARPNILFALGWFFGGT